MVSRTMEHERDPLSVPVRTTLRRLGLRGVSL